MMKTFSSNKIARTTLILAMVLFSMGCSSVPDNLRGTTATPQQNILAVEQAPQLYVGQESRFGGNVMNVLNKGQHTQLEIAVVPLDSGACPRIDQLSQGRILANISGFIDPVNLLGQWVTVVGPITGSEKGMIGGTPYRFVVVQANAYQRWRVIQRVMVPHPEPWGFGRRHHGFYNGFGPEWGMGFGYSGYPSQGQVETILVP